MRTTQRNKAKAIFHLESYYKSRITTVGTTDIGVDTGKSIPRFVRPEPLVFGRIYFASGIGVRAEPESAQRKDRGDHEMVTRTEVQRAS